MNNLGRAAAFLRYYINAANRHGLHSPFVYQLNEAVFRKDKVEHDHITVEAVRKRLLLDTLEIKDEDFGAGTMQSSQGVRKLKDIVRSSSKSPRYGRMLYRLVHYLRPAVMLEMGTAVGISAMYQCLGNPGAKLITLEGNSDLAGISAAILKGCNAEVICGDFKETLPAVIDKYKPLPYVFIDGNHRKEAVLTYFEQLLPYLAEESVLVIDDINWSESMREAWSIMKADPRIQVSVDIHQLGLLFVQPGLSKQDFTIRY